MLQWQVAAKTGSDSKSETITIEDTLPDYLEYVTNSLNVQVSYGSFDKENMTIRFSNGSTASVTFEKSLDGKTLNLKIVSNNGLIPSDTEITMLYQTRVLTEDLKNAHPDEDSWTFSNRATVKFGDAEGKPVSKDLEWSDSTPTTTKDKLSKGGTWDHNAQTIAYQVVVNADGKRIFVEKEGKKIPLEELELIDTLLNYGWETQDETVELIFDSVHLYEGAVIDKDDKGNILNTEVASDRWRWNEDLDYVIENNNTVQAHIIRAHVPNEDQAYTFVYSYKINMGKSTANQLQIANTCSINGTAYQDTDDKHYDQWKDAETSGGIDTDGLDIIKVDSANNGQVLKNVEFTLYEYDGEKKTYLNTHAVFVTDEKGKIILPAVPDESHGFNFKAGTAYYLEESETQQGYLFDPVKIYFCYPSKSATNIPPHFDGFELRTGHNHTKLVANSKKYTWNFHKSGQDADGKVIAENLEGAVFTVEKWEVDKFIPTGQTYTSDREGNFQISWTNVSNGFQYEFNRAYRLVETTAPDGYKLDSDLQYGFHFNRFGELPEPEHYPPKANKDFWDNLVDLCAGVPEKTEVANKEETGYRIRKLDGKDDINGVITPLEGVKFAADYWNSGENKWATLGDDATFVTDKDGYVKIKDWVFEHYADRAIRLFESQAPTGYVLPEKPEYIYLYYSDKSLDEISKPEGFTGVNVNKHCLSVDVRNFKSGIHIKKKWFINDKEVYLDDAQATIGIYQKTTNARKLKIYQYQQGYEKDAKFVTEFEYAAGTEVIIGLKMADLSWGNFEVLSGSATVNYLDTTSEVRRYKINANGDAEIRFHTGAPFQVVIQKRTMPTFPEISNGDTAIEQVVLNATNNWEAYLELPDEAIDGDKRIQYVYLAKELAGPAGFEAEIDRDYAYVKNQDTITISNRKKQTYTLPETGGTGTTLFTLAGTGLTICGVLYLTLKKRRN